MGRFFKAFFYILIVINILSCVPIKNDNKSLQHDEVYNKNEINSAEISSAEQTVVKLENGTGFIIDSEYILTANHVIEGRKRFTIKLRNNETRNAEIVDANDILDLAILKTSKKMLPNHYFPKNDNLKKGDIVFTIGFPASGSFWNYNDFKYSGSRGQHLTFSGT